MPLTLCASRGNCCGNGGEKCRPTAASCVNAIHRLCGRKTWPGISWPVATLAVLSGSGRDNPRPTTRASTWRARSRFRRQALRSSEFVHPACLDSISHRPIGRDHSAHIPDRGNFHGDRLHLQGWPASGPGRLRPGLWSLTGVSAVAPGLSVTSRDRYLSTCAGCSDPMRAQSRLGWRGVHVHSAGHPGV